ncbi:hypothetical protein [Microbacterium lacus]|uniref:Uncharacterized protein n=1 Tax=Microbacterium lacus TaxID=415217 RepID=A0ABN2FXL8_9MICO
MTDLLKIDVSFVVDKGADLAVGLVATVFGIITVFLIARPRIEFADSIVLSTNPDGSLRYGVRVRPRSRLLELTDLRLSAYVKFGTPGKTTSVPVPLSRDHWSKVRRLGDEQRWTASPQLFLREVHWRRHLTRTAPPRRSAALMDILSERNGRLVIEVTAVSAIFSVTTVSRKEYTASDFDDSDAGNPPTLGTVFGFISLVRRGLRGSPRPSPGR